MPSPTLLIFGAGPNTGVALANKFRSNGYKVAIVARSPKPDLAAAVDQVITADLSSSPSSTVKDIFDQVTTSLGAPNVVVYNAWACADYPNASAPFSTLSPSDFERDLAVNVSAGYAAAHYFSVLTPSSADHSKVFIATGNMEYSYIVPEVFSLGVGKNAMAYVIETAATQYGTQKTPESGFWYVADERMEDGGPIMSKISGEAHAEFYWELARKREQGYWYATFVKGKGYVDFESQRARKVEGLASLLAKTKHL